MDFDFFGNQISAHNTGPVAETIDVGVVEDKTVPIPHFGAVLDWDTFQTIAATIREQNIRFEHEPMIRFAGKPGEQMTMFLRDPSGNALEFKAYKNFSEIFGHSG